MAQDHDQSGGYAFRETEEPPFAPAIDLNVAPPLDVTVDFPELRYQKLSRIVSDHTVPRLLALHGQVGSGTGPISHPATEEVHELGRIVLGPESDTAADFVLKLRDRGVSLDDLHSELLGPTAAYLGELWDEDRIDFVDVTLGVARLQRLVVAFGGLDSIPGYDDRRKILLVGAPGEQHSLGNNIIQRFFRTGGWHVWNCTTTDVEEVGRIVAEEWFGVVGFSLSLDSHFDGLNRAVSKIRAHSVNPKVGIIVGGSAIQRHPGWVRTLGADGTAENGPAAVILAKKLLAAALARDELPDR